MRSVIIWHGIFVFNTNSSQTPIKYTFPLNIVYNGWWIKIQPAISRTNYIYIYVYIFQCPLSKLHLSIVDANHLTAIICNFGLIWFFFVKCKTRNNIGINVIYMPRDNRQWVRSRNVCEKYFLIMAHIIGEII